MGWQRVFGGSSMFSSGSAMSTSPQFVDSCGQLVPLQSVGSSDCWSPAVYVKIENNDGFGVHCASLWY